MIKVFVVVSGLVLHYPYWDDPARSTGPHIREVLVATRGLPNSAGDVIPDHEAKLRWTDSNGDLQAMALPAHATLAIAQAAQGQDPQLGWAMDSLPLFSELAPGAPIRAECLVAEQPSRCLVGTTDLVNGVVTLRGNWYGNAVSYNFNSPQLGSAGAHAWRMEALPKSSHGNLPHPTAPTRPLAHGIAWSLEVDRLSAVTVDLIDPSATPRTKRLTLSYSPARTCDALGALGSPCAVVEIANHPAGRVHHGDRDLHFDALYHLFDMSRASNPRQPRYSPAMVVMAPPFTLDVYEGFDAEMQKHVRGASGSLCFGGGGGHPWP